MRWSGKQTQDVLFKREKYFAVISLAQSKKKLSSILWESESKFYDLNDVGGVEFGLMVFRCLILSRHWLEQ